MMRFCGGQFMPIKVPNGYATVAGIILGIVGSRLHFVSGWNIHRNPIKHCCHSSLLHEENGVQVPSV